MASIATYINKFGRREGRKRYNAFHRKYKKANRARINTLRRARRNYGELAISVEERAIRKELLHKKNILWARARSLKRRSIGGSYSPQEWEELLKQFKYRCAHCKKKKPLVADHIVPISLWHRFFKEWIHLGLMTYDCNDIENIQPLCARCNGLKFNKLTTGDTFTSLPKA